MTPARDHVTDAELTVLKALWERGASTIRELTDALYPGGGAAHYATVQKLLERLEAKTCVKRRPRGRVNVYTASRGRKSVAGAFNASGVICCSAVMSSMIQIPRP